VNSPKDISIKARRFLRSLYAGFNTCIPKVHLITPFLLDLRRKGFVIVSIPATLKRLYSLLYSNDGKAEHLSKKARLFLLVTGMLQGKISESEGTRAVQSLFGLPLSGCSTKLNCLSVTVQQIIWDGMEGLDKREGRLLASLAETLTHPDTPEKAGEAYWSNPVCLPIIDVYSKITERYSQHLEEQKEFDPFDKPWDIELRSLDLPDTDTIFSARASHTISRMGMNLSNKFINNLKAVAAKQDMLCLPGERPIKRKKTMRVSFSTLYSS